MPVFELHGSRRGRVRAFTRAQLPLLTGALFISVEGVIALPTTAKSPTAITGVLLVVVVSVLFLAMPWERWPVRAMIPLALADVVAVALMRLAYFQDLPSVGLLAVFPVVWLAYTFGRWAIMVAIFACFLVTLLPVFVNGPTAPTALTVASVITLPVIMSGLAVAVGEAARQLAASQQRLRASNRDLQQSLNNARDSDLLSRTLFEAVPAALAFYDPDHQLLMSNDRAHQAAAAAGFRLANPPFAGPHVRRADNTTPIPVEDQIVPRALRGELNDHEMEWVGPPGRQVAIAATAQTVTRADGSLWGTLVEAHDVTQLARSLQVKDEFIATVSHELRTPLTSIRGYLEILNDELDTPTPFVTNALAITQRNAERLERRVHELLHATKQATQPLRRRHTDLTVLIARTVANHIHTAETKGLRLLVTDDPPCDAQVDAERIEQVLDNLISNAIKYTPAPGHITVTAKSRSAPTSPKSDQSQEPGQYATITVTDTGRGMSPDEVEQAFDTFWRANEVRRDQIQGFGIGLGVVHSIITAHQGTIDIESQPGTGTTVIVTLPT